jgi:hypothetical protein
MGDTIKKLELNEMALFAINHIPDIDKVTLEKFIEFVNATGTFGAMSHEQVLTKMALILKYVPDACPHSLMILADLLEIPRPAEPARPILPDPAPQKPLSLYERAEIRSELRH